MFANLCNDEARKAGRLKCSGLAASAQLALLAEPGAGTLTKKLIAELSNLTTPHIADGCLRTGNPVRFAPAGTKPLVDGMRCLGRARPIQHNGSIDIFLEALEGMSPGVVLVVDNGGRLDEACIGDIVLLEAKAAGAAGFVVWGLVRDTKELSEIGFPVFSLGSLPTGPQRSSVRAPDVLERASIGRNSVTSKDIVVADENGVLFIAEDRLEDIVPAAMAYRDIEARQLKAMAEGQDYRTQVRFAEYLSRREQDPGYGFRQHLKDIEAAGEI